MKKKQYNKVIPNMLWYCPRATEVRLLLNEVKIRFFNLSFD